MSVTWALLGNDDLTVRGGKLGLVYGALEVRQRILVTLRHHWYEYWLNLQGGVPWYELILGSKDTRLAEAILRKVILGVPGVIGIASFQLSIINRDVTVDVTVEVEGTFGPELTEFQFSEWAFLDFNARLDSFKLK
jgi:hypothetical protein